MAGGVEVGQWRRWWGPVPAASKTV